MPGRKNGTPAPPAAKPPDPADLVTRQDLDRLEQSLVDLRGQIDRANADLAAAAQLHEEDLAALARKDLELQKVGRELAAARSLIGDQHQQLQAAPPSKPAAAAGPSDDQPRWLWKADPNGEEGNEQGKLCADREEADNLVMAEPGVWFEDPSEAWADWMRRRAAGAA